MELNLNLGNSGVWLEHYAIEEGPKTYDMSRVAQDVLSKGILHDMTFAVCKYVASPPQSSAERIQWDRVSLDSQILVMSLEHLALIEKHYWQIEGVLKAVSNTHTLRPQHESDSGMILFENDMSVVAYYNTQSGAGWIAPDLSDEATVKRQYAGQSIVLRKYLDNPAQGIFFAAQVIP